MSARPYAASGIVIRPIVVFIPCLCCFTPQRQDTVGRSGRDPTYGLPNPNDEHLVAAVVGRAGAIVSQNAKDLPSRLIPDEIQVVSAARFAADAVSVELLRNRYGMDEAVRLITRVGE